MRTSAARKALLILLLGGIFALSTFPFNSRAAAAAAELTAEEKKKKEEEEKKKKDEAEAKRKIRAFEEALRSGNEAKIHAAARRLESDPVAVKRLRKSSASVNKSYRATVSTSRYQTSREEAAKVQAAKERAASLKQEQASRERAAKEHAASLKQEQASRERAAKEHAASLKQEQASRERAAKERAASLKQEQAAEERARADNSQQKDSAREAERQRAEEVRRTTAEEKKRQAIARSNAAAETAAASARAAPVPPRKTAPAPVAASVPTASRPAPPPPPPEAAPLLPRGTAELAADDFIASPRASSAPVASPAQQFDEFRAPRAPANLQARSEAFQNAGKVAQPKVDTFEAAVRSGNQDAINRAAHQIQSDQAAVQRMNQTASPQTKQRMAEWQQRTQGQALQGTQKDLGKVYGEGVQTKTFSNPRTEPHVADDLDAAAYSGKGSDVPHAATQKALNKNYYDAVGGKKVVGDITPDELAARHRIVATSRQHPEAYLSDPGEASRYLDNPRINVTDPNGLKNTIGLKSNAEFNEAARLRGEGKLTAAEVKEADGYRQAAKQWNKQTAPRIRAQPGHQMPKHVEDIARITDKVGKIQPNGKVYTPAEAEAALAKMGETPRSAVRKMSGLSESSQVLKPPGQGTISDAQINEQFVERVKGRLETSRLEKAAGTSSKTPYQEPSAAAQKKIADHRNAPKAPPKKQSPLTEGKSSFVKRTPGEFAKQAGQAAMTATAATALTAGKIAEIGSEKLKSGEDLSAMDAARTAEAGLQAIPHYGLSKHIALGTGKITYDKAREVLIRRDIRNQLAGTDDPKRREALEGMLEEHGGKLTEQEAALDPDDAAAQELGGYFDSGTVNVIMRTAQGKDTFVGDAAGKVAGVAKTIVVDMPAENWNRNIEEARAQAKAEGREGLTAGEYAGAVGGTAFDTVSDLGPKQAAEGIHTILSGWEADRAEQGARDELRGSLDNKFTRHTTSLAGIQREIEALDPNDPQAQQKKDALLGDYNDHYTKMQGMGDIAGRRLGDPAHRLGVLDAQLGKLQANRDDWNKQMEDPDFRKAWFDAVEARSKLQDQVGSGESLTDKEREFLDNVRNRRGQAIDPANMSDYADMFVPKGDAGTQEGGGETAGEDAGEGSSLPGQGGETEIAADGDTLPEEPERIEDPSWLWDDNQPGDDPGDSGDDTPEDGPSLTGNRVLDAALGAGPVPTDGQQTMEDIMEGSVALAGDSGDGNRSDDLRNAENGGGGSYRPGSDTGIAIASKMNVSEDIIDQRTKNAEAWSTNAQATSSITTDERGNAAVTENVSKMGDIAIYGDETADNIARIATTHETATKSQETKNKQDAYWGDIVTNVLTASVGAFTSNFGNDIGRGLSDSVTGKSTARVDPTSGDTAPTTTGETVAPPPISDPQVSKPPPKKVKKNTRKNRKGGKKGGKKGSKGGKKGSNGGKKGSKDGITYGPVITVKYEVPPKPTCTHKPGGCPGKSPGQVCHCGCGKRR